jgi:hypothetical protein
VFLANAISAVVGSMAAASFATLPTTILDLYVVGALAEAQDQIHKPAMRF